MPKQKDPLKGIPQINAPRLNNLLKLAKRTKEASAKASGELGEAVRDAVENHHLHRGAFNTVKRLARKENEDLAHEWHVTLTYMEMSGLLERIASVPSLKLVHDADEEREAAQAAE